MKEGTIELLYNLFKQSSGVTTDTRAIQTGNIFFALKGLNFNGNLFAGKAIESGAAFSVVDDKTMPPNDRFVLVDDVLKALQDLAGFYRSTLAIPVIGITGSNGKTTTKELIHLVLSRKFKTSTTRGNLNNHIGIPLTLLNIPQDAEMAVVEMGANHQQEIAGYCQYAQPTHGIITNCGKAHLEGFGGVEGIRKGKGELFDHLALQKAQAFVCSDFDYFHWMVEQRNMQQVQWYGTKQDEFPGVKGKVVQAEPFLEVEIFSGLEEPISIKTNMVGDYNIYNVLSAVVVGKFFGVPIDDIKSAIESYYPDNSRSQLIQKDGNSIILDAYNANPTSMAAAVKNFAAFHADQKILMLGAMAELGDESLDEHQELINLISRFTWAKVILVGGDFGKLNHPYQFFSSAKEVSAWWKEQKITGANILLKGSRSASMEKVFEP